MSVKVASSAANWRNFVWAGVVASVVAWTWAWYLARGSQLLMIVVALAAVALTFRAVAGIRIALVGLIVAGFAMFLASLYWMFWVMLPGNASSVLEAASLSLFPMVAAAVLLVGAVPGFRHARES
jgi:hypothetical protein